MRDARRFGAWVGFAGAGVLLAGAGAARGDGDGLDTPVRIDSPADGALIGKRDVHVAGHVEGAGALTGTVIVNGVKAKVDGRTFTADVTAKDGTFGIEVVYGEPGSPASVATRRIGVDATPPDLSFFDDDETVFASGGVARIRGTATDRHLREVLWNGKPTKPDRRGATTYAFDVPFVVPVGEVIRVEVEAVDEAENHSKKVVFTLKNERASAEPSDAPPPPPGLEKPARLGDRADAIAGLAKESGAPASAALTAALRWLVAHQSADGSWSAAGWSGWCDGRERDVVPIGAGKPVYDLAVTGLATLAFLGAGITDDGDTPSAHAVSKAMRWLASQQDDEGCFGARTHSHYIYGHATAALAYVEAYAMTKSPVFRLPAQRGLDFCRLARNPYFGWRYGIKPGDNDTSVTGWMATILLTARLSNDMDRAEGRDPGLSFENDGLVGAMSWLEKMTDPDTGRVGYINRGSGPARPAELVDKFPGSKSESMTAVGLFLRRMLAPTGLASFDDRQWNDVVTKGTILCAGLPPRWDETDGSIDFYYWHWGSLAMAQSRSEAAGTWRRSLVSALVKHQQKGTDVCGLSGSWDPVDVWGPDGGRVYATAIGALCLEDPYRYTRR
jgi:hypothetical protein